MKIIYADGCNPDFIILCHMLDTYLNHIVGCEENRLQYIQYNKLEDIHDVIIVYDEAIPIGCASFKLFGNDIAEVKRVFIKEEYRGKGISKELLNLIEERAKEKGFKKLILESGEPLVQAMSLYKKSGYVIIENYGQYKCMKDSICMGKTIIS
ncbi:GNAT family N-acetyltransferase [[Clostridium] fimetarium]|uniref:Acetyltransferase (GNAT) family protein n=1 Tax=[Clostridium] fimetarium TaxID=99656 RepID=A0A1I0PUY7_9FIRM|nr:GNAT family N-acetyltransferase [[Clostridium] fimetarium]SEW18278.1 Acetyltransferase (GNAT) family protein [[Clostridium] fimetarium]